MIFLLRNLMSSFDFKSYCILKSIGIVGLLPIPRPLQGVHESYFSLASTVGNENQFEKGANVTIFFIKTGYQCICMRDEFLHLYRFTFCFSNRRFIIIVCKPFDRHKLILCSKAEILCYFEANDNNYS